MDEEALQAGSRPAQIDGLLSAKQVSSFATLLAAYRKAGIPLQSAIDGGAGAGWTAKSMLPHLDGMVFAFEPFPGNHRFFRDCDPRIILIRKALGEANKPMPFRVSSTVSADSEWGRRGMEGYSSVGRLVEEPQPDDLTIEAVRADDAIPTGTAIDFVKLDLQGGELNALRGMTGLLPGVSLMWVEYEGQPGLPDFLLENFEVFDTEYTFVGEPPTDGSFDVSEPNLTLSTGHPAWQGFRREGEVDFSQNTPTTYYV
jgi:FkbM family methyltransferase